MMKMGWRRNHYSVSAVVLIALLVCSAAGAGCVRSNRTVEVSLRDGKFTLDTREVVPYDKKPLTLYLIEGDSVMWHQSSGSVVSEAAGKASCIPKYRTCERTIQEDGSFVDACVDPICQTVTNMGKCGGSGLAYMNDFQHTFCTSGTYYFVNHGPRLLCRKEGADDQLTSESMIVEVVAQGIEPQVGLAQDHMKLAKQEYKEALSTTATNVTAARNNYLQALRIYRESKNNRRSKYEGKSGCTIEGALNYNLPEVQRRAPGPGHPRTTSSTFPRPPLSTTSPKNPLPSSTSNFFPPTLTPVGYQDCIFPDENSQSKKVFASRRRIFTTKKQVVSLNSPVTVKQGRSIVFVLEPGVGLIEVPDEFGCTPIVGGLTAGTSSSDGQLDLSPENAKKKLSITKTFQESGLYYFAIVDRCKANSDRGRLAVLVEPSEDGKYQSSGSVVNKNRPCSGYTLSEDCETKINAAKTVCDFTEKWATLSKTELLELLGTAEEQDSRCPRDCAEATVSADKACGTYLECSFTESEPQFEEIKFLGKCYKQAKEGYASRVAKDVIKDIEDQIMDDPAGALHLHTRLDDVYRILVAKEKEPQVSDACLAAIPVDGSGPRECDSTDTSGEPCCTVSEVSRLCQLQDGTVTVRRSRKKNYVSVCEPLFLVSDVDEVTGLRVSCNSCERFLEDGGVQSAAKESCLAVCDSGNAEATTTNRRRKNRQRRSTQECNPFVNIGSKRAALFKQFLADEQCRDTSLPTEFNALDVTHPNYPSAWLWNSENQCTEHIIRDQGSCSCCWAFATSGVMSDRLCRQSPGVEQAPFLSQQELISCSAGAPDGECTEQYCNLGCLGGYLDVTIDFIQRSQIHNTQSELCGQYSSSDAADVTCAQIRAEIDSCPNNFVTGEKQFHVAEGCYNMPIENVKISDDGTLTEGCSLSDDNCFTAEEIIQLEIMTFGPVTAGLELFEEFLAYEDGIYESPTQYENGVLKALLGGSVGGHALKIVGWGTENGIDYWLCENQWGADWGRNGFVKIRRGAAYSSGIDLSIITFDPYTGDGNNSFVNRVYYTRSNVTGECYLEAKNQTSAGISSTNLDGAADRVLDNTDGDEGDSDGDDDSNFSPEMVIVVALLAVILVLVVLTIFVIQHRRSNAVTSSIKLAVPEMHHAQLSGNSSASQDWVVSGIDV